MSIVRRAWFAACFILLGSLLGAGLTGCLDKSDPQLLDYDAASFDAADLDVAVYSTDGNVVVHSPEAGVPEGSTVPEGAAPEAAPASFTISGTVTGLKGQGLELFDNSFDSLTIAADGPFTFKAPIGAGGSYLVIVSSQPATPGQTCTVANGSGTPTNDVTDVAVTCTTNTYVLGGTVVGLGGTSKAGLVLANGADTVTVDQNGAFTFPAKVESGGAYAVTVKANPASPAQTCNVSGGTGTIVAGDVSSVVVNCATNAYIVSGTVSALAGSGLVLHDGADDVAITANGSFAFPTPILSGHTYAVTVKAQPTNPSQTCAVTAGSGTVGSADVSSVRVACVTNPFPVGGSVTGLAGGGLTLVDNKGETVAVSANGTFAFPSPILSGDPFTVSVKTQPTSPWQTCAVTNASGSVGNGPVTTVQVTCTTNTYGVGGAVSGLAGGGLVLALNGTSQIAIKANGKFTFPSQVPSGAAYKVAVSTQPSKPSQTCTVTGGQGKVAGSAVADVSVACTTNTYPVGGTVNGLAGAGLVLTVNGGDAIAVAPGTSSFAFKTPIASGQTYDVEVATQPSGPSQTCTMSGNQGTIVSGGVTSVVVNCATDAFSVGGTVSGLAGGGLLLQNGASTLALTANGSFAFAAPVLSGAPYDVQIKAQPKGPSQTCTVSSATGTVAGGDVTSVQIACATDSFPVGGTVSSLAGAGLVLQNDGGDDLAVGASGSFTFATKVASGAPYAVTVRTQPTGPWQTCGVVGGAGSVGDGPVTGVGVTCATNTYAIGGGVTGLAGGGLTLALNGGSPVAIAKNGTFKLPTPVASGAAYSVVIATQPSGPSQTCTLTHAKGTVAGGDVTNIGVACATNTYVVSGTITGLQGAGLTLTNDGGDAITLGSGVTAFTFPTSIASGQTYDVEVATQPSGPTQSCSVSGGQGAVVAGDVTNVVVNCATKSFTVGGSVSGLAGTGLVLQNGGATVSVNANGSFAFATPVASGSAYAVTVKTEPSSPTQVCTVANGSGSVGGANVNTVSVTCKTSVFAVRGTISGLAGSGLVLQDNGGDDLAVSGSSFAFKTPVASGAGYAVTVRTNPTSPWQQCAVTSGGSGKVGAGDVTDVVVTCTTSTFAVGYTVSGLAGSGLTLTLNGNQTSSPKIDGTYTFPTAIASGAGYTVAVKTQPTSPTQTCAVTNPKGTVAGADVTSVSVTCTTSSFTVGGSVTGLTGKGLVLYDNKGDALNVSPGATSFTFKTPLLSGAGYAVTVGSNPSSPTQSCSVSGASGTVGNGNVTSVSVNCATNSYTISGVVNGLAGSGLVLSDGTSSVGVNGTSFSFPAHVSGTPYNVQPTAQPTSPWQTCSVQNASGTLTGANVTNVIVNCTTNTYPLTVVVSGQVGQNFQISDGIDTIYPAPSQTTYTFPTYIASNQSYSVTFPTQPIYPWQYCYTQNGSGVITSAGATVNVYCSTNTYYYGVNVSMSSGCYQFSLTDGTSTQSNVPPPGTTTTYWFGETSGQAFTISFAGDWLCHCGPDPNTPGPTSGTVASTTLWAGNATTNLYCSEFIQ